MSHIVRSSVLIGTRVPKTEENRLGWVDNFKPDINKPCVIVLPGDGTDIPKQASGMLKPFEYLLKKRGCSGAIDCCAVYYRFNRLNGYLNTARHQLMNNAGRGIDLRNNPLPDVQAEISNPQYIDELFDAFFKERIQTPAGKKLPVDEVVRMMRNVTFFGHCHGAYTYTKLEEKLADSLKLLGYTASEQALILKNVSGVMYAPYAPLGNSKTNVVSFANVQDRIVQHHNQFQRAIQALDKKAEFSFSYFPDTNGNVFLSPTNGLDPHNWNFDFRHDAINALKLPDSNNPDIPDWIDLRDGDVGVKTLENMMGNAVVNNALRGLESGGVPSAQSLVCDYREIGDGTIKTNEEYSRIYHEVYHKSAERGQKHLADIRQNVRDYHKARKEQLEHLRKIEVSDHHKEQLEFDRACLSVQNKDGFAFLKKDSPALEFFKEKKIPFEFDETLDGYVFKGDVAKYLLSLKHYAQMRLDDDFVFIFERKKERRLVSYESPDGCYISPERAAKLIKRYRDVNSYNPRNEIDLEYDAKSGRLKIADHSVKIYEQCLTERKKIFDVFSSLELKDDRYVIRFKDTEGFSADKLLKTYKGAFRGFGVNTSIDGEYLVFDDINEIRRLNNFENIMGPYDGVEDFLPASIAHYFSNKDVDLNTKEIKTCIQNLVKIEKGLSPFIRYDYRGMWVKFDTQDGQDLLTELNNRAKAYGFDSSYFSEDGELYFDDKMETKLFLEANINKNSGGLVPIDEANAHMAELMRDFKREGIQVAPNMDTRSRTEVSDLTNTPEGHVDNETTFDGRNSSSKIKRVKEGISRGRDSLNRTVNAAVAGAVGVGLKVASPLLNTEAGQKVVQGVAKVHSAVATAKAGAVASVSKLPGGGKALQALRVAGKVAKVGGPVATVVTAAIDPKGTKEMISDVCHGRFDKIARECWEGVVVIASNPEEIPTIPIQLLEAITNTVSDHYKEAETFEDYASKTGEALSQAGLNVADVLTHLGGEGFDLLFARQHNARMEMMNGLFAQFGSKKQLVIGQQDYKHYQNDPLKYMYHVFNPIVQDKETGLRDDDTFFSVIESGNVARLKAFIERGGEIPQNLVGQPIAKDLDGLTVKRNGYNPYTTPLGVAIGAGQMDMAALLYHKGGMDINGINEATKDTTLMSLLYQMAPDESVEEYYTGAFLNIAKNESYSPKAKKDFMTAMAMVDAMLQDETLDIHATNTYGKDAFMVAVETGHSVAVDTLLKRGADIHRTTKDGSNALHLCTHNELMTYQLIAKGVDVNQMNKRGKTPLMMALEKHQNINTIAPLLAKTDDRGLEALLKSEKHIAQLAKYVEKQPYALCHVIHNPKMMNALLSMGLDANIKNPQGKTPLMLALETNGTPDISMSLLLDTMDEKGVDTLLQSKKHTELFDAYLKEKPEILMVILASEKHPLHPILAKKHPELLEDVQLALQEMDAEEKQVEALNMKDGITVVVAQRKEGQTQAQTQEKKQKSLHADQLLASRSIVVPETTKEGAVQQSGHGR